MKLKDKGNGNLVPYLGRVKRKWKTAFGDGLIFKNNTYYIEDIVEPIGHMVFNPEEKVYGVNVYNYIKKYLFSMSKKNVGKYFKPMTQESKMSNNIKILFESKKGKQVLKTFKTIKEAKEYISKNKSNIHYGQVMEW